MLLMSQRKGKRGITYVGMVYLDEGLYARLVGYEAKRLGAGNECKMPFSRFARQAIEEKLERVEHE